MRRKIDVAEVEAATKIRARYLRALENEEFDLLPGRTFVRTFLRTYADFLGLDAQLLVDEYRVQHEPQADDDAQRFTPQAPRPRERRHERDGGPSAALIVGSLFGVLLLVFLIVGLVGGDGEPKAPRQTTESVDTKAETAGLPPDRERAAPVASDPAPEVVTLRIAPAEPTYVCVENGRRTIVFEGTLSRPRSFRARRLRVNIGKTSARLRVNGDAVALERGPDPVALAFSSAGEQTALPDEDRPCT